MSALEKANAALLAGVPVRRAGLTASEADTIKSLTLLTMKPVIYAANVADADLATGNAMTESVRRIAEAEGAQLVLVSAQVESELAGLEAADRADFLAALGVTDEQCGLKVIDAAVVCC